MTILECGVKTCTHNAENKCCLDKIKIEGKSACSNDGTLCSDFRLSREGVISNKIESIPSDTSKVNCEAEHCVYNEENMCCAKKIDVCGKKACVNGETECGTFKCK